MYFTKVKQNNNPNNLILRFYHNHYIKVWVIYLLVYIIVH